MPAGNMPVQESEHSEEVSTEPCSPDEQSLSPPLNTTTAKTAPFLVGRPAEPAAIPAPTTAAPAASGAAPTCTVPRSSGKKRDDDDVPMDDAPGGDVSSSPGVTDTVRLASVCVGDGAEKEDARASLAAPATAIAAAAEPCTADDVDAERHRKDDSFTEMLEGRSGPVGAGEKNGSFPAGRVTPSAGRLHVDKRYAVEDVYSLGGGRLDGSPEGAVGGRGNREAEEEEDYYDEIPVHPTPNRAERKSRQAMNKLGLRAVPGGVYRMEMKMSHGVVFVVKNPDVFKHPRRVCFFFCVVVHCLICFCMCLPYARVVRVLYMRNGTRHDASMVVVCCVLRITALPFCAVVWLVCSLSSSIRCWRRSFCIQSVFWGGKGGGEGTGRKTGGVCVCVLQYRSDGAHHSLPGQ